VNLAPDNREAFLSVLTPPIGYRVEAAVGTTYTVDVEALTAAVLTLGGYEWPEEREEQLVTWELIGARCALIDRVRVFFDQGRMAAPPRSPESLRRVSTLDRFLVARQQPSAFHPKVWVVKFVSKDKASDSVYRLLCASRNLTVSASWEAALMMEGVPTKGSYQVGASVGAFLEAVSKGARLPRHVRTLLEELKTVSFTLPGTTPEQVDFVSQWPAGKSLWEQVPKSLSRVVVVSPFVELPFLRRLRSQCSGKILVLSTLEALAPLRDDLKSLDVEAYIIRETLNDQDFCLHAKLLLVKAGAKEIAYLGSANATGAAWGLQGRNTEAVFCLRDVLRMDAFVRAFADPKNELARWLQGLDEIDTDQDEEDVALENAALAVRQKARFDVGYNAERGVLTVAASQLPMPVKVRPLTLSEDAAQTFHEGQTTEHELSVAQLTRFLVVTVTVPGRPGSADLIFVVDVRGAGADLFDRRDADCDAKDPGALEEALLNLFGVDGQASSAGSQTEPPPEPPSHRGSAAGRAAALSKISLERVLRACGSRPDTADVALRMVGALPTDRADALTALIRRVQEAQRGIRA
jgi:hypothetical protein